MDAMSASAALAVQEERLLVPVPNLSQAVDKGPQKCIKMDGCRLEPRTAAYGPLGGGAGEAAGARPGRPGGRRPSHGPRGGGAAAAGAAVAAAGSVLGTPSGGQSGHGPGRGADSGAARGGRASPIGSIGAAHRRPPGPWPLRCTPAEVPDPRTENLQKLETLQKKSPRCLEGGTEGSMST